MITTPRIMLLTQLSDPRWVGHQPVSGTIFKIIEV